MFKSNDEVVSKWTNQRAKVLHVDSEEMMTVQYRTRKFSKGNLEGFGEQVLIKNFVSYKS